MPPGIAICARTTDGAELAADWLRLACASPARDTDEPPTTDPLTRGQIRQRARALAKSEPLQLLAIGEREAVL